MVGYLMVRKGKISISKRSIYFIIGMVILTFLMIFSFQWDELPFSFVAFGKDVTKYTLPPFLILLGAMGTSLLKSGITGKEQFDT